MKHTLLLVPMMILAFPAQAHAGFFLGYVMGANKAAPATAIPPACFFASTLDTYKACRSHSAWDQYGNTVRESAMGIEYEKIIVPLQEQDKQATK